MPEEITNSKTHEMTKIVIRKCQDCGKPLSMLTNASACIMAVRCPECHAYFEEHHRPKPQSSNEGKSNGATK